MANGQATSVNIVGWPREPLGVHQLSEIAVKGQVPVCIRVCEPICARSDYEVGITIFDRPVATISVRGETRIFDCNEKR
jgi:hypothetical protein